MVSSTILLIIGIHIFIGMIFFLIFDYGFQKLDNLNLHEQQLAYLWNQYKPIMLLLLAFGWSFFLLYGLIENLLSPKNE